MRCVRWNGLLLALLLGNSLFAQTVGVRDGGTREVLESIFIPPMANAPFQLALVTEWTRPLGQEGTYTLTNRRRIMRDGAGRIYQERWLLVPKGGKIESTMNVLQIADPVEHVLYNCFVSQKQCNLLRYGGSPSTDYRPDLRASGPLPNGAGFRTHEELGLESRQDCETKGYRDRTTINPGIAGNDRPMVTTREFWYCSQLGINLSSMLDSPESGRQKFTVTELSTSEPDPEFFVIPPGYKVVDLRNDSAPQY
ncbi:MAG: hypothetical protein WA510_13815 [Acidobacteriaceae bacterium]